MRRAATVILAILGLLLSAATGPASAAGASAGTSAGASAETSTDYGRMILVLDSSGSMKEPAAGGGTKIAAAKQALDTVVGDLPADADVGLRVFGAKVFSRSDPGACTDSQLVVKPGTDNREQLTAAVAAYKPFGETPIAYALRQAARDIGSEGKRSIVLVSDGQATCDPDPCVVARELSQAGVDLQIDVVGLGVSGAARQQLQCVAEKGNGTYYDVDSADEITRSLTRVATRAVRPFTVDGRPIEGSTDATRPTPIGPGDWSDNIGPKGSTRSTVSYVFDRKRAGTTIRVSAVTPGDVGEWDGLEMAIAPADGSTPSCDTDIDYRDIDYTSVIGAEVAADGSQDACGAAGKYVITLKRWLNAPAQVPVALRVSEEPKVEDTGEAPAQPRPEAVTPEVSGTPTAVIGGSSFSDATQLATGRYTGTIVPGEAQVFRVPLRFGQHLRYRLHVDQNAAIQEKTGFVGPFLTTRTYNPMHAAVNDVEGSHTTDTLPGNKAMDLIGGTAVVTRAGTLDAGNDTSMSGDYYIGMSVQKRDFSVEWPYTLDVQVVDDGTAGGTAPTYAGGASWSVASAISKVSQAVEKKSAGSTDGSSSSKDSGATTNRADDSSGTIRLVGAGGLGLIALLCVIGAAMLLRRRTA